MTNREPNSLNSGLTEARVVFVRRKMDEDHKPSRAQQPQENDGYTIIVVDIPLFHVFNEM